MASRRFLAFGAAIALVIGVAPTAAFAEEEPAVEPVAAAESVQAVEEQPLAELDPAGDPAPPSEDPAPAEPRLVPPAAPETPATRETPAGSETPATQMGFSRTMATQTMAAETYPINLEPGYVPVPFEVVTYSRTGWTGPEGNYPYDGKYDACSFWTYILVDKQYVGDLYENHDPGDGGPLQSGGMVRLSLPGQHDYASPWSVSNRITIPAGPVHTETRVPIWSKEWVSLGNKFALSVSPGLLNWYDGEVGPPPPRPSVFETCMSHMPAEIIYLEANAAQAKIWWNGTNTLPTAMFEWELTDPATREVTFTNSSWDAQDTPEQLRYSWDFGDGQTSTARNPKHNYAQPGRYTVILQVTDNFGESASTSREVVLGEGLIVNSVGDAPARDAETGCFTGGTVGPDDEPECTLRAAIEAANAAGGGEIAFDIEGSPVISLGSPLPAVTTPTTIDGTTQAGGWVEVMGGGQAGLRLSGAGAELRGLALHGAEQGVLASEGEHRLSGVRLGLDIAGAPTGDTELGLGVTGGHVVLEDSAAAAVLGVAATAPVEVTNSRIGIDDTGAAATGSRAGIVITGPDAKISGSTIHGETASVLLLGGGVTGAEVTDNLIGLEGSGIGVSVQGAPGARIVGNTIAASGHAGVLVSGSDQTTESGDEIELNDPLEDPAPEAVTGGAPVIERNTISGDGLLAGIWAWAGAAGVQAVDNTVSAASRGAILLDGGSGHRVVANLLGSAGAPLTGDGVSADDTGAVVIERNAVHSERYGVRAIGGPATIRANTVTGSGGDSMGIGVESEQAGAVVTGNTVRAASIRGISLDAPAANVTGNTVVESGDGIVAAGEGLTIESNLVGVASSAGAVVGNSGTGIRLLTGVASIRANTVAGSGGNGIHIGDDAKGALRANRIWSTTGIPIQSVDQAPLLAAALISDTQSTSRTTLLVTGIPDGPAGTIEVFANDSCNADGGEARHVTSITRQTKPGRTSQIIQFQSARDHFTLTYTSADGATSTLSACRDRATYPDDDGDGSPDPLDGLVGGSSNARIAVIATANEQLLVAAVADRDDTAGIGGGVLENLRVVDDPTPGSHPSGWSLPYGTLSFRIAGLEPGASAQVSLTTFFADDPLQGNAYWKYGSPSPGAAATWYDFAPDAATGTGAQRSSANVPGLGLRTVYLLTLTDGARGDVDGAMNGTITDPGGPVVFAGGGTSTPGTTPNPTPGAAPNPVSPGLSTTGSDDSVVWLGVGVIGILCGMILLSMGRRVRGRARQ